MLQKYIAHNSLLPFYLAWQMETIQKKYNICFSYELNDENQINLLINGLQNLIQSKAHLRQTFTLEQEKLICIIHDVLPAEVNFYNTSDANLEKQKKTLNEQPHEIGTKSSIRLSIINIDNCQRYIALFNIHHILIDGFSLGQFIHELNSLLANNIPYIESIDSYISRVANEPQLSASTNEHSVNDYLMQASDIANNIDNELDNISDESSHYNETLPAEIMNKLYYFNKEYNLSTFNSLLIAFRIFTGKIFDLEEILINYPVNIRQDKSIHGCFINLVPLAINISKEDNYLSIIQKLKSLIPNLKLISKSKIDIFKHRPNVIPSFSYSNLSQPPDLILQNKNYSAKSYPQIANANLAVKYCEHEGKLYFSCEHLNKIFSKTFAATLLLRFFNFINKLITNPSIPLRNIDLTSNDERIRILDKFNNTKKSYPKNKNLVSIFKESSLKYPKNISVIHKEKEYTYLQLENESNLLALHILKSNKSNLKKKTPIAILSEKGYNQVIGALSIMKAGYSYLPLSIEWPTGRLEEILKQSDTSTLLISRKQHDYKLIKDFILKNNYIFLVIEDITEESDKNKNLKDSLYKKKLPEITENDLAYVIFTSGSTGKPKGVSISHKGALNTIFAINKSFNIKSNDKVLALSEFSFDLSVYDIFGLLAVGGTIIFPEQDKTKVPSHWLELIIKHKITLWNSVPQLANLFIDTVKFNTKNTSSLRVILLSGDWIPVHLPSKLRVKFQHARIISLGGATEGSIWSIWYEIKNIEPSWTKIPYGFPMPNQKMYILSQDMQISPIGLTGEIYIGGAGVALNYFNDEVKTQASFIEHSELLRLYKTGDLGKWHNDGNIEFLGRKDNQVKINGCRIELEEISAKITQISGVDDVISIVSSINGATNIISYYTGASLEAEEIKTHLKNFLPDYMLPAYFIHLAKFPLTANGKLDKARLLEPKFELHRYETPNNKQELLICEAFSYILDIDKIGVNDDFFKLGGDSLKAIKLISILQKNFLVKVIDIYNLRTPKLLAINLGSGHDVFKERLELVKQFYIEKKKNIFPLDKSIDNKLNEYHSLNINFKINPSTKKPIVNILLTGATGFLGCHILYNLLALTSYNIYLTIRANSYTEATDRIERKFKIYFNKSLNEFVGSRIIIVKSDLEKTNLDLSDHEYRLLNNKIDSVIHCAALTKHYGEYDRFYSINVQATVNLLEFSKTTKLKDFHYISTLSVLNEGCIPNIEKYVFTEDDTGDILINRTNNYAKTKYEGETIVKKYQKQDVVSNIYRIGNLAFNSENYRPQENIDDNGFFNRMKCLVKLGMIADEIGKEEISPVNLTAQAIVKLFDKHDLNNNTYHVFNPNLFNLVNFFARETALKVKKIPINSFIDCLGNQLNFKKYQDIISRFLLHQGWLDRSHKRLIDIHILQNRTQQILKQLDFEWSPISHNTFNKYIENLTGTYHEKVD